LAGSLAIVKHQPFLLKTLLGHGANETRREKKQANKQIKASKKLDRKQRNQENKSKQPQTKESSNKARK
jgi:hypothetical protein